jgi:nitrogen fixation NifU-like protein
LNLNLNVFDAGRFALCNLDKGFRMIEERGSDNPILTEHFTHPRNIGEMENPDGVGEAQNPVCGDTMRLFIKVVEERINDAKSLTYGCSAAIASSSITTEMIKGKTIEEALAISNQMVAEALGGLPPTKIHCSVLAEKAIQAAVMDFRKKTPASPPSLLPGEKNDEGRGEE